MSEASAETWLRIERRGWVVTAAAFVGVGLAAGVPTAIGIGWGRTWPWLLGGLVLLVTVGAAIELVRWRHTGYRVGADRVELRTGIIGRHHKTLPRERIRVVDLSADPLSRMVGLLQVRIGTGEQGGDALTLWPVTAATGERLRAELTNAVEPTADGVLATLRPAWLWFGPLSFVTPLIGLGAGGVLVNVSEWAGLQDELFAWVGGLWAGLGPVVVILVGAAAVAVVGSLGAFAVHVELWFRHRLEREPSGMLRARRGLLTTRSISIEERRLRGAELVEPLGNRLAGAARVDAVATGMKVGDEDKSESRTLLPGVPRAEALRVADRVLGGPVLETPLAPHPAAARGRRIRWALGAVVGLGLVLAALGLLLWWPLLHAAWVVVLIGTPVGLAFARDAYRALGHALTDRYLVARHGTVRRTTVALDRAGIVGWTVRRTWFQRRLGLATLTATTGAGSGGYALPDVGESEGLALAGEAGGEIVGQFLVSTAGSMSNAR